MCALVVYCHPWKLYFNAPNRGICVERQRVICNSAGGCRTIRKSIPDQVVA